LVITSGTVALTEAEAVEMVPEGTQFNVSAALVPNGRMEMDSTQ
jgi:hypothetical protein